MHINAEHGLQQSRLQHLQGAVGHGDLRLDFHHLLGFLFVAGLALLHIGQLGLLFGQGFLGLLDLFLQRLDRITTGLLPHRYWHRQS